MTSLFIYSRHEIHTLFIYLQDQVLSITNIIMDELLGDDRAPRAFRAKFPEEVLQESLAGQLWFGAECLAAGSSIMNREAESATMRPLAKAVTKSLDHVRNLLREQCLRNKTPNSLTLNLDLNDSIAETLCESLKIFDRLFAEFELLYVSAMVQVKSKQEHETQELITVLFSETLQRALRVGLLQQDQVDYYDPALMFSIPRLAIVAGLRKFTDGPLNMFQSSDQLSEMFRPFRTLLIKIRDLLFTLNDDELYQLERLLCTNEDLHTIKQQQQLEAERKQEQLKQEQEQSIPIPTTTTTTVEQQRQICDVVVGNNKDDRNDDDDAEQFNGSSSAGSSTSSTASNSDQDLARNVINNDYNSRHSDNLNVGTPNFNYEFSPRHGEHVVPAHVWTTAADGSQPSTPDDTAGHRDGRDGGDDDDDDNAGESASGYLIPNTNFGNLLQTTDAPLTDSFIASDDEYATPLDRTISNEDEAAASSTATNRNETDVRTDAAAVIRRDENRRTNNDVDSGVCTAENTSIDHTPDSESSNPIVEPTSSAYNTNNSRQDSYVPVTAYTAVYATATTDQSHTHYERRRSSSASTLVYEPKVRTSSSSGSVGHHHGHSSRHQRCEKRGCTRRHHQHYAMQTSSGSGTGSSSNYGRSGMRRRWSRYSSEHHAGEDPTLTSSTSSTSSTNSDSDMHEETMALRAASRMKFKYGIYFFTSKNISEKNSIKK